VPGALAERLTAQLLSGPRANSAVEVAERLLAIQAQDPRGARLAVRARSEGVAASDVDRALTDERSLLITTLNRGTLHLVRSEDYPWLLAVTTPPQRQWSARRLEQEGVSPRESERAVALLEGWLADDGPLTRPELRKRLADAGIRTEGQAFIHIVLAASLQGLIVRGPVVGKQHAFVLARDWLGEQAHVERDAALAELARRYLAGHGPAGDRDLARWAGLPLRDARAGLESIARELVQREDGLVDLAGKPPPAEIPEPRLLGSFEPVLLGWASRADIVGEHEPAIVSGGLIRPFAMVRGRAVATWRLDRAGAELEPFGRLPRAAAAALRRDATEVERFLST
jgi:Winged helix DNA-binding domain